MIPKIIHYVWFGGNPLPDDVKQYIVSWKKYCPDYKIIRWDESNFDVNQNQYCKEAYQAKKWAFVSDYIRLKVLYEYGGIYLDSDVEVVKPLDNLLKYDAFSGYESVDQIPTGTMGAVAHNEWIELLLNEYVDKHFFLENNVMDLTPNVTGITSLTKEKYHIKLNGKTTKFGKNMILLPFDYLCAKDFFTGVIHKTENTYTIHHFSGSWKSEKRKRERKINEYLIKHLGPKLGKYVWYIFWYIFIHKRDKLVHVWNKHILGKNINEDQL